MRCLFFTFIIIVLSFSIKAQHVGVIYKRGKPYQGKIAFNRQDQYVNPVKLIQGTDVTMHTIESIDSIKIHDATYSGTKFKIGQQEYRTLSRIYFQGKYKLYTTRIDQYGEIQLIKLNDQNLVPIFEFNVKAIFNEIMGRDVFIENIKREELLSLSLDFHDKEGLNYKVFKLKFRLPTSDLKLSFGAMSMNLNTVDPIFDQQADNRVTFGFSSGLDLKMSRIHLLLNSRFYNFNTEVNNVDFSDQFGEVNLSVETTLAQIGFQLRADLLANKKFTPYIKFGPNVDLSRSHDFSYSVKLSDDRFVVQTIDYRNEGKKVFWSPGIGFEYSAQRHNVFVVLDINNDIRNYRLTADYNLFSNIDYKMSIEDELEETYLFWSIGYSFQLTRIK